jgi:hypothetical protein
VSKAEAELKLIRRRGKAPDRCRYLPVMLLFDILIGGQ